MLPERRTIKVYVYVRVYLYVRENLREYTGEVNS